MSLPVDEVVGQLALGQQGIGGDGLVREVEGLKERDGHANLVGLFDGIAIAYGEGTDFFGV
jgi:hypothetical protein